MVSVVSSGKNLIISFFVLDENLSRKAKEDNKGVLVNCCSPGFVQTDMTSQNNAGQPLEVGARTSIWLAEIPDGQTGPQGCYLAEI